MNNQVIGIITIVLCALGYFYSWRYQTKGNFTFSIFLLLICGFTLRLYTSADFFLHRWDESYHALVAKNLINHPLIPTLYDNPIISFDFKSWTSNYIWLHKQPLPLWTMAGSMWIFGVNEIALRLPSIILTTIGIWLTFYIASYFFNKRIGYLSAFFYSINGLIIELTTGRVATDHIDIFFLFFIELAIFFTILFVQKKKDIFNVLAGISIGAAILSKWLPAFIVLPIWLLIVMNSKQFNVKSIILNFLILISFSFMVFIPWQMYIYNVFPVEANWEASFNFKHILTVLDEQGGPFYYYLNKIRINYGELIYLPLIWFIWKSIKNIKDYNRVAICIWFLIPIIFFSIVKTKMQAYILFTAPALFIITAEFWYFIFDLRDNKKYKWLIYLLLILIIALPVRYSIERIKPFEIRDRNPEWVSQLKTLKYRNIEKGVLFNYAEPISAMFYTNLTVYPNIPEKQVLINLLNKGYTVIINDNGNIPEDILLLKGIEIVKLIVPDIEIGKR